MKLGLVARHGLDRGTLSRHARLAEDSGVEFFFFAEDYFYEDVFSRAGFVAAVAARIGLGVGVINPYTRHPALVAMSTATLDRISGGRVTLVFGRSNDAWMEGLLGYDVSKPLTRLREFVHAVKQLLAGEAVTFEGASFILRNAKLKVPPIRAAVPMLITAMGPKILQQATSTADGVFMNVFTSPEYVRWAVNAIKEERGNLQGIEFGCPIRIIVTDHVKEAMESVRPNIALMLSLPRFGELYLKHSGFDQGILASIRQALGTLDLINQRRDPMEALRGPGVQSAARYVSDDIVEAFTIIGPITTCREKMAAYARAGLSLAVLSPPLQEFENVVNYVDRLRIY